MSIVLRDYQDRSNDELFAWFDAGNAGHPLMVLPTGAGKSIILAAAIRRILAGFPDQRIGMLTHVKELIEQNYQKLVGIWPEAPAGIYSASLKRRDAKAQILYSGIQSVANKAYDLGWFDLIFIDECHLVPKTGNGRYQKFIQDVLRINPYCRIIGLTATPFRLDSGYLHKGKDALFTDIATEVSVLELLEGGYLAPLVSKATGIKLDTHGIKKRGGDFITGQIDQALHDQDLIARALEDAFARTPDRKRFLVFAPTVATAEECAEHLREKGMQVETLSGATPTKQREQMIADYKAGRLDALCNCEVLTTGFDAPEIDCIILLRPTESTALHIQMLGRGMRIAEGKTDCLVLDYVGNIERHGCIDDPNIRIPKEKREDGIAPTKICPECEEYNHAAARECAGCGFLFPEPERQIDEAPSTAPILSTDIKPDIRPVFDWDFKRHCKQDKPDSLRVDYMAAGIVPMPFVSEWVCFEHTGFAQQKAQSWWLKHGGEFPAPKNTSEALERRFELTMPTSVQLKKNGRYHEITNRKFEGEIAA